MNVKNLSKLICIRLPLLERVLSVYSVRKESSCLIIDHLPLKSSMQYIQYRNCFHTFSAIGIFFFTPTRLCSANFLMKLWSQIVFSVSLLHQVSPSSRLILCQAPPTIPFLPSLIMQSVGNRCPKVVKYSKV